MSFKYIITKISSFFVNDVSQTSSEYSTCINLGKFYKFLTNILKIMSWFNLILSGKKVQFRKIGYQCVAKFRMNYLNSISVLLAFHSLRTFLLVSAPDIFVPCALIDTWKSTRIKLYIQLVILLLSVHFFSLLYQCKNNYTVKN